MECILQVTRVSKLLFILIFWTLGVRSLVRTISGFLICSPLILDTFLPLLLCALYWITLFGWHFHIFLFLMLHPTGQHFGLIQ